MNKTESAVIVTVIGPQKVGKSLLIEHLIQLLEAAKVSGKTPLALRGLTIEFAERTPIKL